MLKILIFSIFLIFLSLIAGWVGTKPGSVQIIWLNYDIKTASIDSTGHITTKNESITHR